jgi:YfiH family protein
MFTRQNGVSSSPYSSLNVSYSVGDDPVHVTENRRRIKNVLGIRFLVSSKQVHGDRILPVRPVPEDTELEGYDALVTDAPGTGLLIQQADCQAILLHDPVNEAIGAIHCGWRGSVLNIVSSAVHCMQKEYRTEPASLRAVISPSLGPCCAEFVHYRTELPETFHQFQPVPHYFDFWKISFNQLLEAGLSEANIDCVDVCTGCSSDFFSYRRSSRKKENHSTGRNCSVICLA